jgi:hypothetical protein
VSRYNGGVVKKNFYENPLPREWAEAIAALEHDPEHQRQAAQRRASLDYIRDHLSELRKDHLNRWVAVLNARVVVEGDTLEQVVAELERRRVPLGSVATQFVYPEDTEFIL